MRAPVLSLRDYGVAFGEQIVLSEVTLEIDPRSVFVLMGPGGAGKSTLLRTIAGLNDAQPALRTWGEVRYVARPLPEVERPAMVQQDARLLTSTVRENLVSALPDRSSLGQPEQTERTVALLRETGLDALVEQLPRGVVELSLGMQRRLALARAIASGAPLVLVDEPTVGLEPGEVPEVAECIRRVTERAAVLLVTHDRRLATELGSRVALLAGGRIQESAPPEELFTAPRTEAGRSYVRTGGCAVPSPMARREDLSPDAPTPPPPPPAARAVPSQALGPRGFYWLIPGKLGGTPRPGIVEELDEDLEALARLGVTTLVTLEEKQRLPATRLARHGIEAWWVPIEDMAAPSEATARELVARIDRLVAEGHVVAVHCLAGLGRTGTVLAAHRVLHGASALEAIEEVRRIRPRSVQSEEQVDFLVELERSVRNPTTQTNNDTTRTRST